MTVSWDGGAILLEGECGVEEAETLLELLQAHPAASVDWSRCKSAHTTLIQVLLAAGHSLSGLPEDTFLRQWILPALAAAGACTEAAHRAPPADRILTCNRLGHVARRLTPPIQ